MLVLGVASLDANSAVALLDANSILAAIEEEKLNRSLGADNFPRLAMVKCLEQQGAKISDLTLAALAKALAAHYPIDALAGHSDIAPGRKTDPGPPFDWARLQRETSFPDQYFPYRHRPAAQ